MKEKYMRLIWNGGRVLELKWHEYILNREYWDKQQCKKEEYSKDQYFLLCLTNEAKLCCLRKTQQTNKSHSNTIQVLLGCVNNMNDQEKKELDEKMMAILEENNLDWQSVHLWIMNEGYVIITEEEYDNLEVIDDNGAVS